MEIIKKKIITLDKSKYEILAMLLNVGDVQKLATCTLCPRINKHGRIYALPAQKGCIVGCSFCSVPKYFGDLTPKEIIEIIKLLNEQALLNGLKVSSTKFKFSFVKGGELFLNKYCLQILQSIQKASLLSFDVKIPSVFPRSEIAKKNIKQVLEFYRELPQQNNIYLFVSLLSTSESIRNRIAKIPLMSFEEIGKVGKEFYFVRKRKTTLSITATDDSVCNPSALAKHFSQEYFAVRIYPYKRNAKKKESMELGYIHQLEKDLRDLGYKIIPSGNKYSKLERKIGFLDSSNSIFGL